MYTGQKVKLREYRETDIAQVLTYINDPEIKTLLHNGVPYPMTMKDEMTWFENQSAMKEKYNFAIESLEDQRYLGGCGINALDWKNSVATVGIFIGDKNYWGKGYGTDAMKVLIAFIFDQMNLNKIALHVYSFNERAIKSYEKCGFVVEGRLRKEVYKNGSYFDDVVMGLLKEEYINQK